MAKISRHPLPGSGTGTEKFDNIAFADGGLNIGVSCSDEFLSMKWLAITEVGDGVDRI